MAKDINLEHKWKERVEEYRHSGLSIRNWCKKNEIKETTFKYWINKFNKFERESLAANTDFAEVLLQSESNSNKMMTESATAMLTLSYGNYSIDIADNFNPETLSKLLKVLQKL